MKGLDMIDVEIAGTIVIGLMMFLFIILFTLP